MKAMAIAIVGAMLVLAGCAATTAAAPDGAAKCDATAVQEVVSKAYAAPVGDDVRTRSGSRSVRVIRPGEAVTMDYREDRLNIELDEQGRVRAIRCG